MCKKIDKGAAERAIGTFTKRDGETGEYVTERFPIIVAPCVCGSGWWARVAGGVVWVEAEPEGDNHADEHAGKALEDSVAQLPTH